MHKPVLTTLVASVVAAPLVAWAEGWEDDPEFRLWSPPTLEWAAELVPEEDLGDDWLMDNETPPPTEPWCDSRSGVQDTPEQCDLFEAELDDWKRDFMGLGPRELMPRTAPFPKECPSSCTNY